MSAFAPKILCHADAHRITLALALDHHCVSAKQVEFVHLGLSHEMGEAMVVGKLSRCTDLAERDNGVVVVVTVLHNEAVRL